MSFYISKVCNQFVHHIQIWFKQIKWNLISGDIILWLKYERCMLNIYKYIYQPLEKSTTKMHITNFNLIDCNNNKYIWYIPLIQASKTIVSRWTNCDNTQTAQRYYQNKKWISNRDGVYQFFFCFFLCYVNSKRK